MTKRARFVPPNPPTDDELMLAIRESLMEVVKLLNFGKERGIKTQFMIKNWEPIKGDNPEGPYVLFSLDMIKRVHSHDGK